ncbi:MAG: bepF 3 [Planctomycetaceae bacterium]|nr:bepF 3 [Planctomycetaceae bacterium]
MNRLSLSLLFAVATLLGSTTGCSKGAAHETDATGAQPPVQVTPIKPERKTLVRTIELPGRVEAFEVAPLYAKVTGYVASISVDIGDSVRGPHGSEPGAPLCELLVPELNDELAEKAAAVAQTKAEVLQADAAVKVAQAGVRSADARVRESEAAAARQEALFARWQSEFKRVSDLVEKGAMTRKVADETRSELDSADAGRKEVVARIESVKALEQEAVAGVEKARADAGAARSRLAVAEADHRRVTTLLEYSTIRAPFDGVIVERNVHTGHLVQAGGINGKTPILTVMRADPVRVFIDVPETDSVHIGKKTKVELRVPSLQGEPIVGTITRNSWSLNTTSRTLTAEYDVPNPEGHLRPGLYVQVKLTVAELKNALSLPKTAIVTQDKQTYCLCIESDGKVVRRPITVGLQAGNEFEIRSGLTGNEKVIGMNANAFREGQIVEVAPAK